MGSPMTPLHLTLSDLERSKAVGGRRSAWYICQEFITTVIWLSQRAQETVGGRGFPLSYQSFLLHFAIVMSYEYVV